MGFLVACVVGVLVLLPIVGLVVARVNSTQFVRETEANLYAQAAIYAQIYAEAYRGPSVGQKLGAEQREILAQEWRPIPARLGSAFWDIEGPRPDPTPMAVPPEQPHLEAVKGLETLAKNAQKTTLVGFLALDHQGAIVASTGGAQGGLGHIPEVAAALRGDVTATARWRQEGYGKLASVRSISRDTKFRVYVAHPVVVKDHVIGVIYLSRTPSNINKYLLQQGQTLAWLLAGVMASAIVIGVFLWRFLTRPLRRLKSQARDIAQGEIGASLPGYGVRELADLGQSLLDMAGALRQKSQAVETYTKHATHELKSPVTSIMGAAELLAKPEVDDQRRLALAATIRGDVARMDGLLEQMRDMVRGQMISDRAPINLRAILPDLRQNFSTLTLTGQGDQTADLPLPGQAAQICFQHLLQNAVEHGAHGVEIAFDAAAGVITVADNGEGISPANLPRVTDAFFTTKRATGGTGMGLAITGEILAQFGGSLAIENRDQGAVVTLRFAR